MSQQEEQLQRQYEPIRVNRNEELQEENRLRAGIDILDDETDILGIRKREGEMWRRAKKERMKYYPKQTTMVAEFGSAFRDRNLTAQVRAAKRRNKKSRLYQKMQNLNRMQNIEADSEKKQLDRLNSIITENDQLTDVEYRALASFMTADVKHMEVNSALLAGYLDEAGRVDALRNMYRQLADIDISELKLDTDADIVRNAEFYESMSRRIVAFERLAQQNRFYNVISKEEQKSITNKLDALRSIAAYYQIRKEIIRMPEYALHYNDELSMNYEQGASENQKELAEKLMQSFVLGKTMMKINGVSDKSLRNRRVPDFTNAIAKDQFGGIEKTYSTKAAQKNILNAYYNSGEGIAYARRNAEETEYDRLDAKQRGKLGKAEKLEAEYKSMRTDTWGRYLDYTKKHAKWSTARLDGWREYLIAESEFDVEEMQEEDTTYKINLNEYATYNLKDSQWRHTYIKNSGYMGNQPAASVAGYSLGEHLGLGDNLYECRLVYAKDAQNGDHWGVKVHEPADKDLLQSTALNKSLENDINRVMEKEKIQLEGRIEWSPDAIRQMANLQLFNALLGNSKMDTREDLMMSYIPLRTENCLIYQVTGVRFQPELEAFDRDITSKTMKKENDFLPAFDTISMPFLDAEFVDRMLELKPEDLSELTGDLLNRRLIFELKRRLDHLQTQLRIRKAADAELPPDQRTILKREDWKKLSVRNRIQATLKDHNNRKQLFPDVLNEVNDSEVKIEGADEFKVSELQGKDLEYYKEEEKVYYGLRQDYESIADDKEKLIYLLDFNRLQSYHEPSMAAQEAFSKLVSRNLTYKLTEDFRLFRHVDGSTSRKIAGINPAS